MVALLQGIVIRASSIAGISTEGEGGGLLVLLVLVIGTALTLLGLSLVVAATARALVEIDQGRPIGPIAAYRLAFDRARPLFGAIVISVTAVSLLVGSVVLVPIAVWLAVRWALAVYAVEFEDRSALDALRRSGRLVRRRWLKVASYGVFGAALALILGPLVGTLLIVLTSAPLALLNLVAGVVNAVTMPFVALTTAYVYFDARARLELDPADEADELPAEFQPLRLTMADETDPRKPAPLELDVPPTIPGRIARWTMKARVLRAQVEAARRRHRISRSRPGRRRAGLDDRRWDARWRARLPPVRLSAAALALPRRRDRGLRRHHRAEPIRDRLRTRG